MSVVAASAARRTLRILLLRCIAAGKAEKQTKRLILNKLLGKDLSIVPYQLIIHGFEMMAVSLDSLCHGTVYIGSQSARLFFPSDQPSFAASIFNILIKGLEIRQIYSSVDSVYDVIDVRDTKDPLNKAIR